MQPQRFTAKFKRAPVRLLERSDKPVTPVAAGPGVASNHRYTWRDALHVHGGHALAGSGKRSPPVQAERDDPEPGAVS